MILDIDFLDESKKNNEAGYFDKKLYKERYPTERTDAWLVHSRSLHNRFDTMVSNWTA